MSWVLYGATGFTGELLAEEAVKQGHRPLLAGRSAEKLRPLAERLGLEFKEASLDDAPALHRLLEGHALAFLAAGPFIHTSKLMADACLHVGAHYLDITGEISVIEALYARHAEAERRGVVLLPACGFDVVPSDCLTAHLLRRVPRPKRLDIAIAASSPTAGTVKSGLGSASQGVLARRGGALVTLPLARGVARRRFHEREVWTLPMPLADVATAHRAFGLDDITGHVAIPSRLAGPLRVGWPLVAVAQPLIRLALERAWVQARLATMVERRVKGPSPTDQTSLVSHVVAEVEAEDGTVHRAWLETCEAYRLTALAGIGLVELVLANRPTGARTPSQVAGPDFVLTLERTQRYDEPANP